MQISLSAREAYIAASAVSDSIHHTDNLIAMDDNPEVEDILTNDQRETVEKVRADRVELLKRLKMAADLSSL